MKLYVTYISPYARLARIVVIEGRRGPRRDYRGKNTHHSLAACRTSSMTPALAWRTASSFAPISTASMPRFHDCRAKKFQGMRLFVMVNTARKSHSTILNVRT